MVNQELLNWVKTNLAKGSSEEQIRNVLQKQYSEEIVNEVFAAINQAPEAVLEKEPAPLGQDIAGEAIKKESSASLLFAALGGAALGIAILIVLYFVFVSGGTTAPKTVKDDVVNDGQAEEVADEVAEEVVNEAVVVDIDLADIETEWPAFVRETVFFDEEWQGGFNIVNNTEYDLVVRHLGENKNKTHNSFSGALLKAGQSNSFNFSVTEDYKVSYAVYNCSSFEGEMKDELCGELYMIPNFQVLDDAEDKGNTFAPLLLMTKYFKYIDLETEPVEITESEYNQ